jgi:hypothetical protein
MRYTFLLLILFALPSTGHSHTLSDSYLHLSVEDQHIRGHWLIGVQDMELAIGLDSNADGRISWGEIQQQSERIRSYAISRLELSVGARPCPLDIGNLMVEQLNAGMFLHLPLTALCQSPGDVKVDYRLLFDIDTSHRGIMNLQADNQTYVRLFSPVNTTHILNAETSSGISHLWTFLLEGVWHIWIGLDHILFLVALLVPVVFGMDHKKRDTKTGYTNDSHTQMDVRRLIEIVKIVTAFTIAHSVTLILAALHIVMLPDRLVESVIALSVAISGLNILYPVFRGHVWKFAFGFGLVHGFGFAGVLSDLLLPTQLFISSLLSFNIGVEIGQLVIVLVLVPALVLLGQKPVTRTPTLVVAGTVITGFGLMWLLERSLDVSVAGL